METSFNTIQEILKRLHTKVSTNGNKSQYYPRNLNEQEIWPR